MDHKVDLKYGLRSKRLVIENTQVPWIEYKGEKLLRYNRK